MPAAAGASVGDLLRRRDWSGLQNYFAHRTPETAEDFEARAMLSLGTRPDSKGAQAAAQDLQHACRLQPSNALLAANLAQSLLDCGQAPAAVVSVRAALQRMPPHPTLVEKLALALAALARWDESMVQTQRALSAVWPAGLCPSTALQQLERELSSRWWQPLDIGGARLRLACEGDASFVKATFDDPTFMRRYHRFQATDGAAVQQWLGRALLRPIHTRRCEWLVLDRTGITTGLAGLVDIDIANRRAELVLGLSRPDPSGALAFKATVGVMHMGFDRFGLHKLTSYVYGDNLPAQHNTLRLGLQQEGILREHIDGGQGYVDLYVNGLLSSAYRSDARLQRLVRRWCATDQQGSRPTAV
jgi:RimJ/RimL family protein N-acetyltransferase